jgi:hypothetical protein
MATKRATNRGMGAVGKRTSVAPGPVSCPAPKTRSGSVPRHKTQPPPPMAKSDPPPKASVRRPRRQSIKEDAVGDLAVSMAIEMTMPRPTFDARRPTASLTPREAWILSLVDGRTTVEDLSDVTAIARGDVVTILEKLVDLGYVAIGRFR